MFIWLSFKLNISLAVDAWISSLFLKALIKFLSLEISAANLSSIWEESKLTNFFPFPLTKAVLIFFPFSVLIGIFWRFGSVELNRPVKVLAKPNDVWTLLLPSVNLNKASV